MNTHDSPKPICMLGMHRSGTSAVSRLLNLLGVYLGPEPQIIPPAPDNPKGFWEHRVLTSINDEILSRLGGSWHEPPVFAPGWDDSSNLADLRQRARAVLQEDFARTKPWGWKDPRTCLTLSFWQNLLPQLRYVICVRNPLDVARSLERRDAFPLEKGVRLWLIHMTSALQHTTGYPRLLIFYEDIMENWRRELKRLARFLGRPEVAKQSEVRRATQEFLEETLQHHRTQAIDVIDEPRLAFPAKALYLLLRAYRTGSFAESRALDLEKVIDFFSSYAWEAQAFRENLMQQVVGLKEQLSQRTQEAGALEALVAEARAQAEVALGERETREAELRGQLGAAEVALSGRGTREAELRGQLGAAEAALSERRTREAELREQLAQAEAALGEHETRQAELRGQLKAAEAALGERESWLSQLMREKDESQKQTLHLNAELVKLQTKLAELDNSLFWRAGRKWIRLRQHHLDNIPVAKWMLDRARTAILRQVQRGEASNDGQGRTPLGVDTLPNYEFPASSDPYRSWISENEPDEAQLMRQRLAVKNLLYRPLISIVTPVFNPPPEVLRATIESVLAQTYDHWELCLVDGHSESNVTRVLEEFGHRDSRVRIKVLNRNLGIAGNSNEALRMAEGEFVALLDHDDLLAPFALFEIVKTLNENKDLDVIYSDEDKVDPRGIRHNPFFKPDWSPSLLYASMYVGHLSVYRRSLVDDVGGFSSKYEFSQDYDLALRITERTSSIGHVQQVLYHWRSLPTSAAGGGKAFARGSNIRALEDAVARRGYDARVLALPFCNRVEFGPAPNSRVSIVIPTDTEELIEACTRVLLANTKYQNYEIIVVSNSRLIEKLSTKSRDRQEIRFVEYDARFNFSAKCNLGAKVARGEYLLFLNDDVEPVDDAWLDAMLELFQLDNIGAVGAKLLYRDGTIQHAGLVTGVRGLVGTAFHQEQADSAGYWNLPSSIRNVSALSAACLLIPRRLFEEVGGFDLHNTPIRHSDVDLCFKVRERGYLLAYTPFAVLKHTGHASLSAPEPHRDHADKAWKADAYLIKRWGQYVSKDPYYTDNMRHLLYSDSPTKYRIFGGNGCGVQRTAGDLLLVTHDLSLSGAPLFLLRLAKYLVEFGYFATVVSPETGPLLSEFNDCGIPIVVDPLVFKAPGAIGDLIRAHDVIIPNTILNHRMVHIAREIGKPCVWFLHESQFGLDLAQRDESVASALSVADVVVHLAHATARKYAQFVRNGNHVVMHLGLQVAAPDEVVPALEKDPRKLYVFNIGSIEPRKGQDVLLKSVLELPQDVARNFEIYCIGRVLDQQFYGRLLEMSGGAANIHFLPEKPHHELLSWLRCADVVVCSSRDEVFPAVLIEAAAFGKAIVSTRVGGIPEIIEDGICGLIVDVGDHRSLASNLVRLFSDRDLMRTLGQAARKRYDEYLTIERYGREVRSVLEQVMLNGVRSSV